MGRVTFLTKHFVDLGGDARGEVERVQHEVADQDEVEDALEFLARHQDGDRHRVGWKQPVLRDAGSKIILAYAA